MGVSAGHPTPGTEQEDPATMTNELSAIEGRLAELESIGNQTNEFLGRIATALETIAETRIPTTASVTQLRQAA